MSPAEMVERVKENADQAHVEARRGDWESARIKLAEINNNLDRVLMAVNVAEVEGGE